MNGKKYTFFVRDLSDERISLPPPLEFELVKSFDSPAHSFEGIFPCDRAYPELYMAEVWQAENLLFYGELDESTVTDDGNGRLLRLMARSRGAALLDNEALPQVITDATLPMLFNEHVKPYGISDLITDVAGNALLSTYRIAKGLSEWEAFYNYFRLTGLGIAYVNDQDQMVCLNDEPFGATHCFNNRKIGGLHYSSLKITNNRYSPITRFMIRDKSGVYSYFYDNPFQTGLRLNRKRYLIPSETYTASPTGGRIDAGILVRRSMLGKQVVTLTAPGLLEIKRRDLVEVDTGLELWAGLFVYQVRHRLSAAGETTTLSLLDQQYV